MASAPLDLVAIADVRFSHPEHNLPFGILNCRFTAWSGFSGTHDEVSVY